MIFAGRRGSKSGGFVVAVDDALLAHVDELRGRQGQPGSGNASTGSSRKESRSGADSALSPREMQARLRAGKTVVEVAREAGVDVSWVERFAAPVIAEQAQAVSRASDFTFTTARRGASTLPLAESIAANLAAKGVTLSSADIAEAWSSHQDKGSLWV
ncbi:MAG: septation protein SepH, partial [Acidimicrobiales bacterium]